MDTLKWFQALSSVQEKEEEEDEEAAFRRSPNCHNVNSFPLMSTESWKFLM